VISVSFDGRLRNRYVVKSTAGGDQLALLCAQHPAGPSLSGRYFRFKEVAIGE
jgi:hypothetical protein